MNSFGVRRAVLATIVFVASISTAAAQKIQVIDGKCVADAIQRCIEVYTPNDEVIWNQDGDMFTIKDQKVTLVRQSETVPLSVSSPYNAEEYKRTIVTSAGVVIGFAFVKDASGKEGAAPFACRIGYRVKPEVAKWRNPNLGGGHPSWPNGNPCERKSYRQSAVFERIHTYCKINEEHFDISKCTSPGPSQQELWDFMTKKYFESLETVVKELKK